MPRYFSKKISKEELADKIWTAWENNSDYNCYKEDYDAEGIKGLTDPHQVERWNSNISYIYLTPQIEKDLYKIEFDAENICADPTEPIMGWQNDAMNEIGKNYVGLSTLDNGLTFLGVTSCGDWETPLLFIIYHDGDKLRSYIPKEGNPWNRTTKQAYGNDEEADMKDKKKLGYSEFDDIPFNFNKIGEDIKKRVKYKGE